MPDFSSRISRLELLDTGCMPDEEVRRNLLDMRRINRLFGGRRLLLEALSTEVARHRLTRFTVLDIASGSCDLPYAILDWADRRGLDAQVFALEYWHRHLALFRNEIAQYPGLHAFCGDALQPPIPDQSFDFVTCCNFLHHLGGDRDVELLLGMKRWGRRALIVSDLERHWLPYYFFRLAGPFLGTSSMTRIDGAISIGQSFRKEELKQTAERARLERVTVKRRWPFRLLMMANLSPAS